MIDLSAIRAALAAATPGPWEHDAHLIAAAPAWLAALCDEVERLRGGQNQTIARLREQNASLKYHADRMERARDEARAEVETLRKERNETERLRAVADAARTFVLIARGSMTATPASARAAGEALGAAIDALDDAK